MSKIVVTTFMTLDGVVEAPEKWSFPYWNEESEQFKNEELAATGALLLGRNTYEGFAATWPNRSGDFADRLNTLPKHVASRTLKKLDWHGSALLASDLVDAITQLKASSKGGDIVLHGSVTLAQDLMKHGLIDRFNILLYPIVAGEGKRLFSTDQQQKLTLVESKTFRTGVMALVYEPVRAN